MKETIQKAIEGGWENGKDYYLIQDKVLKRGYECLALLDKDFWQALGKAMGWKKRITAYNTFTKGKLNKKIPGLFFGDFFIS